MELQTSLPVGDFAPRTLDELFPGRLGRLQFVRVMLKLRDVGLETFPRNQALPAELMARVRAAIREDDEVR
ncbi:MAG: hypothetical protein HYV07_28320 [Deltaproteobacteria bacterium]|nr:hypothetical protein [Deltaproteobacteria bacterium]